ncbi:aurora kinase C-like [Clytia hemisphaerica]|uniref:aurora kinase C-like n=1 Tax=Clytia hemisphaerica TaxID=252671 RepID=UPI0034D786F5|eukprot:TCONS_00060292-protein
MKKGNNLRLKFGNDEVSLKLGRILGRGTFGTVNLAIDKKDRKQYAVKMSQCIDGATYFAAAREIEALITLCHANIAKMKAFDFLNNNAVIVMEYCEGGDLNQRLCQEDIAERVKLAWIVQLCDAMIYLHEKGMVHRDLKPQNVLLSNDQIKLTDFGISRYYKTDGLSGNNLSEFLGTFAGTPYWVAPEVFDQRYTETADIFSVGVLCYAILHQESIIYENERYFGIFVIHNGREVGLGLAMVEQNREILPSKTHIVESIDNIIVQLVRRDPQDRVSLKDAREEIAEQLREYHLVNVEEGVVHRHGIRAHAWTLFDNWLPAFIPRNNFCTIL